jgi:hypothetical protein
MTLRSPPNQAEFPFLLRKLKKLSAMSKRKIQKRTVAQAQNANLIKRTSALVVIRTRMVNYKTYHSI